MDYFQYIGMNRRKQNTNLNLRIPTYFVASVLVSVPKLNHAMGDLPLSHGRHVRTITKAMCHQEGYK